MNTNDFEMALRQAVQDWELGKIGGHQAMKSVADLVKRWHPLEAYSIVFPEAGTPDAAPRSG